MSGKSERFEMRLEPELLELIDNWRATKEIPVSRAEAVRLLVIDGLRAREKPTISDGEKLISLLLCDLLKELNVRSEFDTNLIKSALLSANHWALGWEYSSVFRAPLCDASIRSEVIEILVMWSMIEGSHQRLTGKDKIAVAESAEPFGNDVSFPGFDANDESEYYSITTFLIKEMKRFSEFDDQRSLNSHAPVLDMYRRMLNIFRPMQPKLIGRDLSVAQLIEIMNARRYPAN